MLKIKAQLPTKNLPIRKVMAKIEADRALLGMILDTGIGAHAMQGLGFVEVL